MRKINWSFVLVLLITVCKAGYADDSKGAGNLLGGDDHPGDIYENCVDAMIEDGNSLSEAEQKCEDFLDSLSGVESERVKLHVRKKYTKDVSNFYDDGLKFEKDDLESALDLISSSNIKINDGVLWSVGASASFILILKYGRSLNPFGVFALGLGLSPVAASDYCSLYNTPVGMDQFINGMTREEQMSELSACPNLAESILDIAQQVNSKF